MVSDALAEVRRQQHAAYDGLRASSFTDACRQAWERMAAPDSEPVFRLFFEVYGLALRNPRLYRDFLHDTIEQWLQPIAGGLVAEGYKRADARALATVVLAGLRGFMLDFCATHDRTRVDRAVRFWLSSLDFSLRQMKGGKS